MNKVFCILVLLLLAACANAVYVDELSEVVLEETTAPILLPSTLTPAEQVAMQTDAPYDQDYETTDGIFIGCHIHASLFHAFDAGTLMAIIPGTSNHDFSAWAYPLWILEEQTGECWINFPNFVAHFGITREMFQAYIDSNIWYYFIFGGDFLDVLYSGDNARIQQFFSIANDPILRQLEREREEKYWNARVVAAQQRVNENTTEMSRYFHDIWTYSYFSNDRGWYYRRWMSDLIEAGEYDRVNIVEFISYFRLDQVRLDVEGLISDTSTAFERWVISDNMNIFTHYNLSILLSGDMERILEYYSIENEHLHTAAVQARLDAHIAQHGIPDTSWMLPVPPTAETVVVTAADSATEVQVGETLQFNATVTPQDAIQVVQWAVTSHTGVTIDATGLLTVVANVPADTTLTITATPNRSNISGSIEVTVTAAPGNEAGGRWWIPSTWQPMLSADDEIIEPLLQLVFTAGQINFLLDGKTRTAVGAPFLDPATDRMMVPLRTVAESTGVEVRWDDDTRSAVIYLPDEIIIIPVDEPLPDGMGSTMLVNDRTFVPLRFVMEAFGADAQWYEPNLQAIISFY